ncbi:hypothetical protein SAY87_027676 [Trapa incisa]|uniref:LOB domain-containing protein n=1 Tax=Trapa incisa TaxID=236973 RepID=A0AAN7PIH0_9MYRT|nr:hypothetical protein SAY87_027676 [Trapa incisa]
MASWRQPSPSPPPPVSGTPSLPSPTTCHPAGDNNGGVVAVVSPCAACKILRRRCVENCVLAPYFPPSDPSKFAMAHRVFGAANIIKFLQEVPEMQRADAVSSMVYEANARLRDPVYGCARVICQLQKQIEELQAELAKTKAEAVNMQCQNSNLLALVYIEMANKVQEAVSDPTASICINAGLQQQHQLHHHMFDATGDFFEESSLGFGLESYWA